MNDLAIHIMIELKKWFYCTNNLQMNILLIPWCIAKLIFFILKKNTLKQIIIHKTLEM